jgi:hypothetical protein
MDAGAIGSLVADYPLQITAAGDPLIANTAGYLIEHCFVSGAFFQDMIHSGLNAYLTLAIAQTLLRFKDPRYRVMIEAVANLASSTGQWPEAIHPNTGGGCMGDGQHGWAAAEWVMMIRNLFVREEKNSIVIGSGVFSEWFEGSEKVHFGPTLTPAGAVSVEFATRADGLRVSIETDTRSLGSTIELAVPGYEQKKVPLETEIYYLSPFSDD